MCIRDSYEIDEGDATGWYAQKRSTLGAALALTSPGIPMLFQGQEFLQGGWFRDDVPLDWEQDSEFRGVVRLYRDLIRLRRNLDAVSYTHLDVYKRQTGTSSLRAGRPCVESPSSTRGPWPP